MNQSNKELRTLKKILLIDFLFDFVAGIARILFIRFFRNLMNIPVNHILVSSVTTLYSVFAFYLAQQKAISFPLVRLLINANWFWTVISFIFLIHQAYHATGFGLAYLLLPVIVVAFFAYCELQLRLVFRAQHESKTENYD